ncbi:centrosomal protein CEP57L1 isoform X2 [Manis pentadactyla]|uniref:centrosomal protein CEP57L1 isoform X2 n=1 Tax=Manis pentadactyla TaxID=143292 RepID=UPI00255CCFD3|nr:centrosomal protein CEP57L1 isoform X2 [Manis pentadactyla]KAI5140331.1 Centrosomal Protein Cep57L1 [Manis pentadactyla]
MDSELMHSIVGSYLKPPERVFVPSFTESDESAQTHRPVNLEVTSPKMLHSPNSQALILALKALQEKIHRLELERTQAEDNLTVLSREAAQYKKALDSETNERNLAQQKLMKQKKDISAQLSSAQSRCALLEKQLACAKRMVLNAEREKRMILEQQAQRQREKEKDRLKLQAKLEKLNVLEKECFKLTTTQKTAEDKIKHLEGKLQEEEHHRKLFRDRAAELQTGLEINRILMSSVSNPKRSKDKKASKSARAIHSMNVSVQTMQHCGPRGLQGPAQAAEPRCPRRPTRAASQGAAVPDAEKSISMCDCLSELLIAMQDELDQMGLEHQELLNQMEETESGSVCEDIECELQHLVKKMEIKGEQISKLMRHQDNVRKLQQKIQNSKMSEASGIQQEDSNYKGSKNIKKSPRKCLLTNSLQKNNFHPLRVCNLQMKLRRDDIMWEQ